MGFLFCAAKGVLTPEQVGEISRLLGMYRSGPDGTASDTQGQKPPVEELLSYLRHVDPR